METMPGRPAVAPLLSPGYSFPMPEKRSLPLRQSGGLPTSPSAAILCVLSHEIIQGYSRSSFVSGPVGGEGGLPAACRDGSTAPWALDSCSANASFPSRFGPFHLYGLTRLPGSR